MKTNGAILGIFMALCCFAAAKASVSEAKPLSPELTRWALYMTANVEEPSPPLVPEETPVQPESEPEKPQSAAAPVSTVQLSAPAAPLSDGIEISNLAKANVDVDELLSLPPETTGAQVLILHTHGCEAYTPTEQFDYVPTEDFRTTDKSRNVVRVGDEIQRELEAQGLTVIHDTTLCDEPDFNKSYNKSLAVAKKYLAENPNIKVILDVHRDSIEDGGKQIKTVGPNGASQLMFVVGTDTGGLEHPLWRQNLSFALNLQRRLLDKYEGLMRPINLRSSRFNQQLCTGSIIVEVGSDGNTLEEALTAARIFGRELGEYLTGSRYTGPQ